MAKRGVGLENPPLDRHLYIYTFSISLILDIHFKEVFCLSEVFTSSLSKPKLDQNCIPFLKVNMKMLIPRPKANSLTLKQDDKSNCGKFGKGRDVCCKTSFIQRHVVTCVSQDSVIFQNDTNSGNTYHRVFLLQTIFAYPVSLSPSMKNRTRSVFSTGKGEPRSRCHATFQNKTV